MLGRALEDADQSLDEAEEAFFGRRAVVDGPDERPESVAARLGGRVRRLQVGADHVEKHVDGRLRGTRLVGQDVTQQRERALVDLITTNERTNTDGPILTFEYFQLCSDWVNASWRRGVANVQHQFHNILADKFFTKSQIPLR